MCLSTVYINSGDEKKEIMKEVARIEAEGQGFWFINLFGEKNFKFRLGRVRGFNNERYIVCGYRHRILRDLEP